MATLERAGDDNELLKRQHLARYGFAIDYALDKTILDFGCGEGYGSQLLGSVTHHVVSLDVSREAIAESRRRGVQRLIRADARNAPFKTDAFDLIVSFEVFEHIERVELYVEEAHRMLKEGGKFLVSTPNVDYYPLAGMNPFHVREYKVEEVLTILKNAGFNAVSFYAQLPRQAGIARLEKSSLLISIMKLKRKFGFHGDLLPHSIQRLFKRAIAGGEIPPYQQDDYEFVPGKFDAAELLYLAEK